MKILFVTPGITYFPPSMGSTENYLLAKAEGVVDHSAYLVAALASKGKDQLEVHVATPNYFRYVGNEKHSIIDEEIGVYKKGGMPDDHIHRVDDGDDLFVFGGTRNAGAQNDNGKISFAFQREVINKIIPSVKPDLIHCNDWATGLIPAATRKDGIPCLLTLHNIHNYSATLSQIEDMGVSVSDFWQRLYFNRMPNHYEEARGDNPVDMLASAIFSAHYIHAGSEAFLEEIVAGRHNFIPGNITAEITNKKHAGCAAGIQMPINPECFPQISEHGYDAEDYLSGKLANKEKLQSICNLEQTDPEKTPLFFWPSRLDAQQNGCHLLTDILSEMLDRFWKDNIQIVVIANGVYKRHLEDVVSMHGLSRRVAVRPFSENLSRRAYAASDFVLVPSLYEPFGLPALTGLMNGALPVVHDTGGLHDIVESLRVDLNKGNGLVFREYNIRGMHLAIEQALSFYRLPKESKARQIGRIIKESRDAHDTGAIVKKYINLYHEMLKRPLVNTF